MKRSSVVHVYYNFTGGVNLSFIMSDNDTITSQIICDSSILILVMETNFSFKLVIAQITILS